MNTFAGAFDAGNGQIGPDFVQVPPGNSGKALNETWYFFSIIIFKNCRHVPVSSKSPEGSNWQHATFWKSHDQKQTRRRGTHWSIRRPCHCNRGGGGSAIERHRGGRWKRSPVIPGRRVRLRSALGRHQLPQRPLTPRKRTSTTFSPAVHHPHRHRAGGVRRGHDGLLAENRRRAGRVPARVLAALLAVEPQFIRGKMPSGLLGFYMEEAHHRRGDTAVAAAVGRSQPRGKAD